MKPGDRVEVIGTCSCGNHSSSVGHIHLVLGLEPQPTLLLCNECGTPVLDVMVYLDMCYYELGDGTPMRFLRKVDEDKSFTKDQEHDLMKA
jgi:hypothetical protein